MSTKVDEVTDVFVALLTAKRSGMTGREIDTLLQDSVKDLAATPEEEKHVLSLLVGTLLMHCEAALHQLDLVWQQPVTDRWIAAVVATAADHRVTDNPL